MRKLVFKVVGVTFDNRQELISKMLGDEPARLIPEPFNKYDKNAIGVNVALDGEIRQIGYVPKEIAAELAPFMDGEEVDAVISGITGGFTTRDGDTASLGVVVQIEIPDDTETV